MVLYFFWTIHLSILACVIWDQVGALRLTFNLLNSFFFLSKSTFDSSKPKLNINSNLSLLLIKIFRLDLSKWKKNMWLWRNLVAVLEARRIYTSPLYKHVRFKAFICNSELITSILLKLSTSLFEKSPKLLKRGKYSFFQPYIRHST